MRQPRGRKESRGAPVDEITAVKSVGVAGGEPLALVAIFLLLCYAVAWSVDLYLPLPGVESGEWRER